jgi:hypothetical protein
LSREVSAEWSFTAKKVELVASRRRRVLLKLARLLEYKIVPDAQKTQIGQRS